jgi:steroid delta-isomerase-like uncharacterized protein
MKVTEVTQRYHDAWNGRDAEALVAFFAKGGTFINPHTGQGITGEALAKYARGLWTAFPDFSLELVNASEIGTDLVSHQWLCQGTNTGPLSDGIPPTGRSITIWGASIIQVRGDKISSDQSYFDRQTAYEQLGVGS